MYAQKFSVNLLIGDERKPCPLDWLDQPRSLGAAIAPVIGARAEDVRMADSTSINQWV